MKGLLHFLVLIVGLAACSSEPEERRETQQIHQMLRHLSSENKRMLGRSNPAICGFALEQDQSSKYENPRWEDDPTFRKYVDEARRRGFSAHSCAARFGWPGAQSDQVRSKVGGVEYKLTKLKTLYDQGLITHHTYEEKRRQILEAR
jgi:hypothetical protein